MYFLLIVASPFPHLICSMLKMSCISSSCVIQSLNCFYIYYYILFSLLYIFVAFEEIDCYEA
jgi:hypothetical protein